MITKIHTYEGVPIGGNNFEDFLSYMLNYLSANFAFSTGASGNRGGYFLPDAFVYSKKPGDLPERSAFFIGPSVKPVGSLFGTIDNEFYRFEILNSTGNNEPQINVWTVLLTDTSTVANNELIYRNPSPDAPRKLPYRPLTKVGDNYVHGYRDVRLNGIPQTDYDLSIASPHAQNNNNFRVQELRFNSIQLAPELPKPVVDGKYNGSISVTSTITKNQLINEFGSRLTFEFTNFSIEGGGHIVLYKPSTGAMVYVPKDNSSNASVTSGTYRVIDYARGIIELNPSNAQLELLRSGSEVGAPESTVHFTVISAEQLLEETANNVTRYRSRYGAVYNGDVSNTLLAEYIFDGSTHSLRAIPNTEYMGTPGSILLSDVNNNYADGIVLALRYSGEINQSALNRAQAVKYTPDVLQLYYHTGALGLTSETGSNFKAVVDVNPGSWYNQEVISAEYSPVSRVTEGFYFLINQEEEVHWPDAFDPSAAFEIIDTIGISDLNDVNNVSEGDVIVYNGSSWDGRPFNLRNLFDVALPEIVTQHNVLAYVGGAWRPRHITSVILEAPFYSRISYSSLHVPDSFYFSGSQIPHAAWVQRVLDSHNESSTVHGANDLEVPSSIMRRDVHGRVRLIGPPTGTNQKFNYHISGAGAGQYENNAVTLKNLIELSSSTSDSAHMLVRRNGSGTFEVPDPSSLFQVANKRYVDNKTGAALVTFGNRYVQVGKLVLAWAWADFNDGASGANSTILGPSIPSAGTGTILTAWAQAKAEDARDGYVTLYSDPQNTTTWGFSGNRPRARVNVRTDSNPVSVYVYWLIRLP